MVAEGVTRARLPTDNAVVCTLSILHAELAAKLGTTRTAAAIELWLPRLGGAVVAIGNAPTALFRLMEAISAGAPRPPRSSACQSASSARRSRKGADRERPPRHRRAWTKAAARWPRRPSMRSRATRMTALAGSTAWASGRRPRIAHGEGDARHRRRRRRRLLRQGGTARQRARDRRRLAQAVARRTAALLPDDRRVALRRSALPGCAGALLKEKHAGDRGASRGRPRRRALQRGRPVPETAR